MYASGLGRPLLGSLGTDSGLPPMPSLFGGISFTPGGGLGPLPSIASYYGPTAADPRSSGGRGALFPHLDPLPESRGGTGGLLPGFGPGERSGLGGLQGGTSQRTRRRSIGS